MRAIFNQENIKNFCGLCLLFIGTFFTVSSNQSDFYTIISGFAIAFIGYAFFIQSKHISHLWIWIVLAAIAKLSLVFVFPNLSDDIYRFYWDGMLIKDGINPYAMTPQEALQGNLSAVYVDLFPLLNSQVYYSIYPPVSQLLFYLGAFADNVTQFSIYLKLIFWIVDILNLLLIIKLLKTFNKDPGLSLIYFLNPMVFIEGIGNLHFEMIMLSMLLMFLLFLYKSRIALSSGFFSLAIATKLTPLIMGPLILFYNGEVKKNVAFLLNAFLFTTLCFLPVFIGLNLFNLADSIDLYFRKFEYNASVYYLLREFGQWISGYNLIQYIGPLLALLTIYLVLRIGRRIEQYDLMSLINASILSYTAYLFLATTVHPWYLIPLIGLACFKRYDYVILWSFLITLSYYTYSTTDWQESSVLLMIEYGIVFFLAYKEISFDRKFSVE